jgi:hypothetical protein
MLHGDMFTGQFAQNFLSYDEGKKQLTHPLTLRTFGTQPSYCSNNIGTAVQCGRTDRPPEVLDTEEDTANALRIGKVI